MKTVNVGILGIGNVATGTYKTLELNREKIRTSTGVDIVIRKILNRRPDVRRAIEVDPEIYVTDADQILNDPEIDIVVELIGGIEPATEYMLRALESGKHVVTANKAALAVNGKKLQKAAMNHKVMLRFEASVGGGIPIINSIITTLRSNEFDEVLGILNGTTNYILTQMTENGSNYFDVLKDAQAKGFAERDPSGDVEGHDVANKLSVLLSLIFGADVPPQDIPTTGITEINAVDISYATQFGCKIKLIASARCHDGTLECEVQPALIPLNHPIASVNNEFNAIFLKGNALDDMMFYGKGAGPLPTGSAVVGDIIEIACQIDKNSAYDTLPVLRYDSDLNFRGEGKNQYYLRMSAEDRSGVLGGISTTFGKYDISIESMVQQKVSPDGDSTVPLLFIIHETERQVLDEALEELLNGSYVRSIDSVFKVIQDK